MLDGSEYQDLWKRSTAGAGVKQACIVDDLGRVTASGIIKFSVHSWPFGRK
jgi:hypothetical protein